MMMLDFFQASKTSFWCFIDQWSRVMHFELEVLFSL